MAASLQTVGTQQQKRKVNELEDITNSDHIHSDKKLKMSFRNIYYKRGESKVPQQQRSPSPTEVLSSPSKHEKSVSFQLEKEEYTHSPLLTPKDEDDDEDEEDVQSQVGIEGGEQDCGDGVSEQASKSGVSDLSTNTDYIALTSSLRLLTNKKDSIEKEIVQLSKVLQFHENLSDNEQVINFFIRLINDELGLPKQSKILQCPLVDWSKYHKRLSDVQNMIAYESISDENPIFRSLNLFSSK